MQKTALFIIAGVLTLSSVKAQINWGDYSHSYPDKLQKHPSVLGLILAIRKENNSFWQIRDKSNHFHTLAKDSSFRRFRPKEILARTTFDTACAHFFLHGVGPQNAHLYQFRVMEYPSKRIQVPWHGITRFTDSTLIHSSGLPKMAYLGGYKTSLGKMLIIDVRRVDVNQIVATSLIAWESIKPEITSIYTSETMDKFLQRLQSPWMPYDQSVGHFSPVLTVPATNTNLIFSLQNGTFTKKQIQYELIRNGRVYTPWRYNAYDNSFVWIKDYPPGSYTMRIRYSVQPQHIAQYRFEVAPLWYQTNWFRLLAGMLVAGLVGLLFLLIRQRLKTQQEQFNKTKLQLELKAIYAQLNPHFVFNALSSIQGLINKQDIKGANSYLSDFARLMRQSLQQSQKDEIALYEEIQTLDRYLKLEQLRFGFGYTIQVDSTINVYETSVPILLLQPLVENAVKHGVALLGEKGSINLAINQSNNSMIVSVTDNGNGFKEDKATSGLGLKLTRDRINLLNKFHSESQITLAIRNAVSSGTQIILTFSQWF
ncbi:histidine kinase [Larkinella arboricola]|uniref:Histidine kinase n=1 Tax=Larkinella arboricola TaxID=643671 RepID=A0A327X7D5_LARAB|nr:histidine kinase [Larkinella arboricola]RAK02885.1 histidine kinase [Larkinella arboricola]